MSFWESAAEWFSWRVKARIFCGVVIVSFLSLYNSCEEVRYRVWGKTTEGQIRGVQDVHANGQQDEAVLKRTLTYGFMDERNNLHIQDAEVPLGYDPGKERTVRVEYIPNKFYPSRLAGTHNTFWMVMLVLCVVAGVGCVVWLARDPMEE